MKYYLLAGEASGDLHGANLMKGLKQEDPRAEFRFLGGDLMLSEGGFLVKHYSDMAFMGFVEVVANLNTILKNLKTTKKDILTYNPDALILIDFPGFNLKIAEFAKKNNIKVFYYISPKVWAWNQKRVLKIKKVVDKMFCILPFEVDFYNSWGMEVEYVGNPLLDAIDDHRGDRDFKQKHDLSGKPLIALLPGSRVQEIKKLLPDMVQTALRFPEYRFVVAGAPSFKKEFYTEFLSGQNLPVVFNATYDLLQNSEAAIVASGTATLETALWHLPQVVVYKGNALTIAIARALIKIKFISLVNLILNREAVKELIQENCNPDKISAELQKLLHDPVYRSEMLINYALLTELMGKPGASFKTAHLIYKELQK